MNQEQHEYEILSQLWFFEQSYYDKQDYGLWDDPEYLKWSEDRRKEDLEYQVGQEVK